MTTIIRVCRIPGCEDAADPDITHPRLCPRHATIRRRIGTLRRADKPYDAECLEFMRLSATDMRSAKRIAAGHRGYLASVGKETDEKFGNICGKCFGLPWRRPKNKPCKCGGIFAEEEEEK